MPMPARQWLISVLLIVPFLGNPAHAQQTYFGGNVAFMNYATASLDPSIDIGSLYGRVGLGDERGVFRGELRLGLASGEHDDVTAMVGLAERDAELEVSGGWIGAYALIGMPVKSPARPYAFLGYSITDWSEDVCYKAPLSNGSRTICEKVDADADDVSFGIGVDLDVGNDLIVNIEYAMYLDQSVIEIESLSIGVSLPFGF